jgi:AP2 domain
MPKRRLQRHLVVQPLHASYRLIPLTQNKNAIVDIGDFDWLNQWNWRVQWNRASNMFYVVRSSTTQSGKRINVYMHRQILDCKSKEEEGDHRNHNTLDNRRQNLRRCTSANNKWNSSLRKDNTTGFRGVSMRSENGRFTAQIWIDSKPRRLGCYATAEEAARVYDKFAKRIHGDFAHLNFG